MTDFSDLIGKTLRVVERNNSGRRGNDVIRFITDDGVSYEMTHHQDCCESVAIREIVGDLSDLLGSPILTAEVVENALIETKYGDEQYIFYKLSTIKGSVTIDWYGESNGCYSTEVSFERCIKKNPW